MKPERWQQIDSLFHSALEREPEERAAFLDEACAGDESLRKQVEALLAADEEGCRPGPPEPNVLVRSSEFAGEHVWTVCRTIGPSAKV